MKKKIKSFSPTPSPSISTSLSLSYSEDEDEDYGEYYKINKKMIKRYFLSILFGTWVAGVISILGYTITDWQYWFMFIPTIIIFNYFNFKE